MTDSVSATQMGSISTQMEQIQRERPVEPPKEAVEQAAPPPPPPESGRGTKVDTSA